MTDCDMTVTWRNLTCKPEPGVGRDTPTNGVKNHDKDRGECTQPHTPNLEGSAQREDQEHLNKRRHNACTGRADQRQSMPVDSCQQPCRQLW